MEESKCHCCLQERQEGGSEKLGQSATSSPMGRDGANKPGNISKAIKSKKVIKNSQQRYTKEKACLTNLRAFYDEMSNLMDKEKAVEVIYLNREAFSIVSHNILTDKKDEEQQPV